LLGKATADQEARAASGNAVQNANDRESDLLGLRWKRPCRSPAYETNKLASPHVRPQAPETAS
jgi:hypothetical protein